MEEENNFWKKIENAYVIIRNFFWIIAFSTFCLITLDFRNFIYWCKEIGSSMYWVYPFGEYRFDSTRLSFRLKALNWLITLAGIIIFCIFFYCTIKSSIICYHLI